MQKKCTMCKHDLDLECFNKKTRSKDGRQNICKQCTKNCSRKYYESHTETHKKITSDKRKQERAEVASFIRSVKAKHGCQLCPEKEPCCLEFHHIDGEKKFNISDFRAIGVGQSKFNEEICKCVVLCSNCHKKLHAGLIDSVDGLIRVTEQKV